LVIAAREVGGVALGGLYCGYSLLYLASVNAKSEPVRAYYRSVHPLLRLAPSTLILVDRDMLITDSGRLPETTAGWITDQQPHPPLQSRRWLDPCRRSAHDRRGVIQTAGAVLLLADGIRDSKTRRTADHLHVELN